jgi:hypothetical protein
MTIRERKGLVARVRQISRAAAAADRREESADARQDDPMRALEARVAHLEQLLEGLQNSVHRESERQDKRIAELQAQIQPGSMAASLAEDARNRGL